MKSSGGKQSTRYADVIDYEFHELYEFMLTYLIILLDDRSAAYCHYEVARTGRRLMDLNVLKQGIVWAMKENLNIQFVYPDYELPAEYGAAIERIDHTKIKPSCQADAADVIVFDGWEAEVADGATCVVRCSRRELANHLPTLTDWLRRMARLNVVLTDVETFSDADIDGYRETLERIADSLVGVYRQGGMAQLNLLTDRLVLNQMNNCGAGDTSITLAPDGRFYLCPAFYYDDEQQSVGDLATGLAIGNRQLLRLDHAPICRVCDAYHCRRCVWMNRRLTGDLNTPSHQQCVVTHVERNASRYLQKRLEEVGIRLTDSRAIEEMTELDPFNIVNRWK